MKNWFKNLLIPSGEKTTVVAYNSWIVRWRSRCGEYSGDTKLEAEIFPSEQDAYKFAEQLKESFKLLRYSGNPTEVKVEANQSKLAAMLQ